jgi:hypothetical protein
MILPMARARRSAAGRGCVYNKNHRINKKKPSEVSAPDVSDTLFPVGSMKNPDIHVTKLPRRTVRLEITEEPGMCESQDPLYEAGSSVFWVASLI